MAEKKVYADCAHMTVEQLHQELCKARLELKQVNDDVQKIEAEIGMQERDCFTE